MKLVVGLGNAGEKYIHTRHNTGFLLADFLKNVMGFNSNFEMKKKLLAEVLLEDKLLIMKPQTYMNSSGMAVKKVKNYFEVKIEDLTVCYDDLDIEFGKWKIAKGEGPKIHNGVNSVADQLKSKNFWHVRIGIRGETYKYIKRNNLDMAESYILKDFLKTEFEKLYEVFGQVFDKMKEYKLA